MVTIKCPACNSENHERFRPPAGHIEGSVFRRHRCLNCRRIFLTEQRVVDEEIAETLSSEMMPEPEAITA